MDTSRTKRINDCTKNILAKTPAKEGKLYLVNFGQKEYEVQELTDEQRNAPVLRFAWENIRNQQTQTRDMFDDMPVSKQAYERVAAKSSQYQASGMQKYQNLINGFLLIACMALITLALTNSAHARGPQGEFSVLVEQDKSRADFKSKEDMMKYVAKEEKKFKQENKVKKDK